MAAKEKVDIKRSDQFQEMEEALSKAMEDLDTTMDRVATLFEAGGQSQLPIEGAEADGEAADTTDTADTADTTEPKAGGDTADAPRNAESDAGEGEQSEAAAEEHGK